MSSPHVASAEARFMVVGITPDFCRVDGKVIPYDIYQLLPPEKDNYAHTVHSRGVPTLHVASVVKGVIGDLGAGVLTGTSLGSGHSVIVQGAPGVKVEGQLVARHGDLVLMNRP